MIFIVICIVLNALIFIIFKMFSKFDVNTFQAIVFNYFFAFLVALTQIETSFTLVKIPNKPWFLGAVFLGLLFITLFNIVAQTAQKLGVSVVAVASKMSVIIPVIFGVLYYNESINIVKIIGISLALVAVYLSSIKAHTKINKKYIILPLVLFIGSGILDALLNFIETKYVNQNELELYTGTIFLVAGSIGFIILLIQIIRKKIKFKIKNLIAGIVLGIPNYFSIYFLLKALQVENLESATIFTINNVGIVLFSTLIGLIVFKEKLNKLNYFGVILAVVSIYLITLVA